MISLVSPQISLSRRLDKKNELIVHASKDQGAKWPSSRKMIYPVPTKKLIIGLLVVSYSQKLLKSVVFRPYSRFTLLSTLFRDVTAKTKWSIAQLSYSLDVALERHPTSYLLILGTTCLVLIFVGGFAFYNLRTRKQPLSDAFWEAWACLCSSSTHLKERTAVERATGLLLAIGGLLFYSLLTSTLTAQFKSRMEILREGALFEVMEVDHTIICGINTHLTTLLKQLNKAQDLALRNKTTTSRRHTIILLCEKTRNREKIVNDISKECKGLNILVRSGSLSSTSTFQTVGAKRASRVIFLSRKTNEYEADADVVLSLLALQPLREQKPVQVIIEVSKEGTAQLVKSLAPNRVTPIQNLSSKLLVQCSRQNGLVDVYQELLDHGSQVINLRQYPSLAGYSYHDVRRGFHEGIVCGIIRDDMINFHPNDNLRLESTDKLIIICEKNKHHQLAGMFPFPSTVSSVDMANIVQRSAKPLSKIEWHTPKKEYIVILGWRPSVNEMVAEYDDYVGPGSEIMILAQEPLKRRDLLSTAPLKNVNVIQKVGNPLNEVDLKNALADIQSQTHISIVVIIEEANLQYDESVSKSDKQSIYALLLAESVCKQLDVKVSSLVAELVDTKLGKQVVKSHHTLTFIGTSELMGLVTAQVAENSDLNGIWTDLLNSWGNEIYVKDISLYMKDGEILSFQELSDRAVLREEVAIGYRMKNKIVINPPSKTSQLVFSRGDSLVVICEFEYGNWQGD